MIKQGNRGKAFEALVTYSFNFTGCSYSVRLREGIKGAFCLKCRNYINLSNMSRQQPFDYVVIHDGRPFALEAKSVHGVSFPLRNIKEHQIRELERFESHGSSHVLLEFIPGKARPRKYYLVPIMVFKTMMMAPVKEGKERKSIPISELDDAVAKGSAYSIQTEKNTKGNPVLLFKTVLDQILVARWLK